MTLARANYQLDLEGLVDPTLGAGIAAPIGTLYRLLTTGALFSKVGVADTAWVSMLGGYLGRQILTGAGVYTPTVGTRKVLLQMVGGGGGSGGSEGLAASFSVSGGGASGAFLEKTINPGVPITGGAYAVGAGGAGGAAGANPGSAGGDTTITIQTVLYTAMAGNGGQAMPAGATNRTSAGGFIQPGSTAADFEAGSAGASGNRGGNMTASGGRGGSNPLGQGGNGRSTGNTVGAAGRGFGAGGGGSNSTTVSQVGGAGSAGVIIIDEYS